ncbi:MAG: LysR family transcriptional regulator, partial [Myxococcota bacterium]
MDGLQSWDDVRLFLAVVESGSLSAAARVLRLGQPTVSRRIAELEERLQAQLFVRSSEGAVVTAEGRALLPAARRMSEAAADWRRALDASAPGPSGRVRITAPPGIAWGVLVPFAQKLAEELPEIELSLHASIGFLDLARGEADLAIR